MEYKNKILYFSASIILLSTLIYLPVSSSPDPTPTPCYERCRFTTETSSDYCVQMIQGQADYQSPNKVPLTGLIKCVNENANCRRNTTNKCKTIQEDGPCCFKDINGRIRCGRTLNKHNRCCRCTSATTTMCN